MKVFKPGKLSLLSRSFEHNRQFYMGVSVLAFIPLGRTDTLLHEVAMWKFVPERLGAEGSLDVAIPKARGEFLVNGSAYAPGGAPSPAFAVRAAVGPLQKDLAVYGDRYWTGRQATEPRPFTTMPLDWAHAFGGEGYANNPLGKGTVEVEVEGVPIVPLPNIEAPANLIGSPRDQPEPAGFGPLDVSWPQRTSLAGTYDADWLENLFPGFARDVDWDLHNLASPDQRIEGFWQGGEAYRFDNLHPDKVVAGSLPEFRARVFVSRSHRPGQPRPRASEVRAWVREPPQVIDEVPLALQTLWFFPDAEVGVMIWTGSTLVAEEDNADILHLLCAAEHQARPRGVEYYREAIAARLDPEYGPIAALREDELLPEELGPAPLPTDEDAELNKLEQFRAQNLHRRQTEATQEARDMVEAYGLDVEEHGPALPAPYKPPPSPQEIPAVLAAIQAKSEEVQTDLKAKAKQAQAKIEQIIDDAEVEGFTSETLREEQAEDQVGPPQFTAAFMHDMLAKLAMQSREAGTINDEIEEMLEDEVLHTRWAKAELSLMAAYRTHGHLQPPAPAMPDELLAPTRARVQLALANGEDFALLNFTGADLSGMDLSGADLSGALLESTKLEGTNFSGAKLDDAMLGHATMTNTCFDGASMVKTNLGRSTISGASFRQADLREANFYEAKLSRAVLSEAKLEGAMIKGVEMSEVDARAIEAETLAFIETKISGSSFAGAKLDRCMVFDNDLRGSSFAAASLVAATFGRSDLRGVDFRGAKLDNVRMVAETKLDRAVFAEASLVGANCRGLDMAGVDLRLATLDGADFSECDLREAQLYQAVAREARFEVSDLRAANLSSGNFMGASFARATIYGVDLRGANLYGADMARVRTNDQVRLDGALLTKVRVNPRYTAPPPDPSESSGGGPGGGSDSEYSGSLSEYSGGSSEYSGGGS